MLYSDNKNYMFRLAVAIIRLFLKQIKIVLYNSRDGVLMKRSQHQNPVQELCSYVGCVGEPPE